MSKKKKVDFALINRRRDEGRTWDEIAEELGCAQKHGASIQRNAERTGDTES